MTAEILSELCALERERRERLAEQRGCSVNIVCFPSVEESVEISLRHLRKVAEVKYRGDTRASNPDPQYHTAGEPLGLVEREPERSHMLRPSARGLEIAEALGYQISERWADHV
jgi:hypothetical protein